MKFLHRVKACFGWRPGADQLREVGALMAQGDDRASSRLERNQAWMPTFEEVKPLNLPPPACPPLGPSTGQLASCYLAYVAQVETLDIPVANEALRQAGQRLARDLFEKAIDLSGSKAQEFSLDIYWLTVRSRMSPLPIEITFTTTGKPL